MSGGVTVGDSGICCCVPCLLSAINSLCLWIVGDEFLFSLSFFLLFFYIIKKQTNKQTNNNKKQQKKKKTTPAYTDYRQNLFSENFFNHLQCAYVIKKKKVFKKERDILASSNVLREAKIA